MQLDRLNENDLFEIELGKEPTTEIVSALVRKIRTDETHRKTSEAKHASLSDKIEELEQEILNLRDEVYMLTRIEEDTQYLASINNSTNDNKAANENDAASAKNEVA